MKAMILKRISLVEKKPLEMADLLVPHPNSKEMLVKGSDQWSLLYRNR